MTTKHLGLYTAWNHNPHLKTARFSYFRLRWRFSLCRQCPSKDLSLGSKWPSFSLILAFGQNYLTISFSISSSILISQLKLTGYARVEQSSPSRPAGFGARYTSAAPKSQPMSPLSRVNGPLTVLMVLCTSFYKVLTGTVTHGTMCLQATALVELSFIDHMGLKDMSIPSSLLTLCPSLV